MQFTLATKAKIGFYVLKTMLGSPLYPKYNPDDTEGYYRNPNPYNKTMRQQRPIFFSPKLAAWVCSFGKTATFDFAKDERFSVRFSDWQFAPKAKPDSQQDALERILNNLLMSIPKSDHTRIRRLVQPAFLPKNIAKFEVLIENIVARNLASLSGKTNLADVTKKIPLDVMAEIVGFDTKDFDKLEGLNNSILATYSTVETDPKLALAGIEVLKGIIQSKIDKPGDDFISHLLKVSEEDGDALSMDEVMSFVASLLAAGADTTRHFLNSNMEQFIKEGILPTLKSAPDLIPTAVAEAARVNSLSHSGGIRFATVDCEIMGQKIRKGEMIRFNVNTANIDEAVFPEPFKFDMSRSNLKEIWLFGAGSHFCVGAALAKMITYSFFRQFAEKFPDTTFDGSITYQKDFMARNMTVFPVILH